MADPVKALGNGASQQPKPGHLVAPTPVIPMVGASQTPAGPRVLMRLETPTGMFVVLLEPDVADSLSKGLHNSAVQARTGLTIPK
jgi:hypothetical protein